MNSKRHFGGWPGVLAIGGLMGLMAGCTTYVEPPRGPRVYERPAPPPVEVREVIVTPPPPPVFVPPPPVQTVVIPVPTSPPVLEIRSESDFYEPLSADGHWVQVPEYGRCWVPDRVDRDWRPYTRGHWERTDAGWYWDSDERWGWATYHYGRWDWRSDIGWLWVPQTQWAPAWVSFQQGGGYTGWAPLHPSARIREGRFEDRERHDNKRGLVLVEDRRFLEPVRPTTVIVNNTTIINQTVNITSINVVNNRVINEGPRLANVERATGRKVEAVPAPELRRRQESQVTRSGNPPGPTRPGEIRPGNEPRDNRNVAERERQASENRAELEAQRKAREAEASRAAQVEAQRRTDAANAQLQAEAQRKTREAAARATQAEAQRMSNAAYAQGQAEAQRKAREAAVKAAQAEGQRRTNAANMQAQAEAQRKAREAELQAAQAEARRMSNAAVAQTQLEAQRKAHEAELKAAQAEAQRRTNVANAQAQAEVVRKAKEAELKAAQAEAERRSNEAHAKAVADSQKSAPSRTQDPGTTRIATTLAADPALKGITVTRSNGVVHLSGVVTSEELKKRAGAIAQRVEASRPVQNQLVVRP